MGLFYLFLAPLKRHNGQVFLGLPDLMIIGEKSIMLLSVPVTFHSTMNNHVVCHCTHKVKSICNNKTSHHILGGGGGGGGPY
jgi:hypothetical protein